MWSIISGWDEEGKAYKRVLKAYKETKILSKSAKQETL